MTQLSIYANIGSSDVVLNTSSSDWLEIDTTNDEIIFSDGSDVVKDGEAIPSSNQLNSAAPILDNSQQTFDKYFVSDFSANQIREIVNMGEGNYRYVLAFDFDDSTINEPTFEVWDDSDYDSVDLTVLGAGTPNASWFRGIVTTNALPGVGWNGSRLAGSSDGHYLNLNGGNGALTTADTLYCQLKVVIPATQDDSGAESPVIVVKYATV